jgi:integrase/recombinase XerD
MSVYLVAKRQEGLATTTLDRYEWHLKRLIVWLADQDVVELDQVSRDVLREWGAGLYDTWAPATIKQAVCSCRSFFTWCCADELIASDPSQALKLPSVPARVQRTVTTDEFALMVAGCDESTIKGLRDVALISLLMDSGLRNAELCRLDIGDLDLAERLLTVKVKGGSIDYGFFGQSTADRLRVWLSVRAAVEDERALFVSVGGGTPGCRLTPRGLRIVVVRIGEAVGVLGVSPHSFRRGFALAASLAGAPARVVMAAGRWSNIDMVVRYTLAMRRRELYDHSGWVPSNGKPDP